MADYDSNLIKPVKGLQNITGLTPTRRREDGKRRQRFHQEEDESTEDRETQSDERIENKGNRDSGTIDYCA
jgi:hypothetical protein